MDFELSIDPNEPVPIWKQIEEGVRRRIAAGGLHAGDAVPSVREAAVRLRVNPATVARAYRFLVDAGLLSVRRGEGTFVAKLGGDAAEMLRREELGRAARRYTGTAAELGVSIDEALEAVEDAWRRNVPADRKREGQAHG
ncbi:MAG: GntR family transcriptional regulator [Acidobacteria bacterium]|nr:GntR family transcriptional regulator [Acidobacteriota bacterium]